VNYLPVYLDSSALLKLILPEPESADLGQTLRRWPDWVSSAIAAVECRRALARVDAPADVLARADAVLAATTLLHVDEAVLTLAGQIPINGLRSLDALHLASAMAMGDDPDAFVTYDDRLADAADRLKLNVIHPGRSASSRDTSPSS
jgi:predicted nucleic acid-binding protein